VMDGSMGDDRNIKQFWEERGFTHKNKEKGMSLDWGPYLSYLGSSLDCPHVDIVTLHIYPGNIPQEYWPEVIEKEIADLNGRKAYVFGEFGYGKPGPMRDLMERVIRFEDISGALLWNLDPHKRNGGFYGGVYNDVHGYDNRSYRYPGFPSGSCFWEAEVLDILRNAAFQIRGLPVPLKPVPKPPVLLPIKDAAKIDWCGSAGAEVYDVYRAVSADGPWELVGEDISDSWDEKTPERTCCFSDMRAVAGTKYFYRVTAKNVSGVSESSGIMEYNAINV